MIEAHLGAQRRAVRQAALLALDDVERRRRAARSSTNSRRALPEWLEIGKIDVNAACRPSFLRVVHRRAFLQERAVRRELRLEQERHRQHARALGEALADALLLGKGVGRGRAWSPLRYVPSPIRRERVPTRDWPLQPLATVGRASSLSTVRGIAPLAWWLATTSRWRTTSPLQRRPTKPAFRSRLRKRSEALAHGSERFASISGRTASMLRRFGRRTGRVPRLPFQPAKSSGSARDFRLTSFSTSLQRRDFPGSRPVALRPRLTRYLISTFAPASSSFFFAASASAL